MINNQERKHSYFRSPIARKFVLYILLFSFIVTVLGTSLQFYLDYKQDLKQINYVVDQIKTSHLPSVINSIWVADQVLIEIKLKEILSLPNIQYLAIKSDGKLFASAGSQESGNIITREYPLQHTFKEQEIDLGNLYIEASLDDIYHKLTDTIFVTLLILGVEIFIVALFIFLVFYFLIGRDLKVLADYTSNLNLGNLDTPLRLNRIVTKSQYDEIDSVASSLNGMRGSLLREINNLKKAEEEIAKGKAEFAAIFNSITDAIVFVDLQRRIVMTNPAFTKTFGYELNEVEGQTSELLYSNSDSFKKQGRKRYNKDADPSTPIYESEYRRKDGAIFTGETLGAKVLDENDELIGFLGIIRDVTDKKLVIAEKDNLETNLRQAYKMEALGTMAGGIAHDFNNILAIILGNIDFALDDIPDAHPSQHSLKQALGAANRAKDLVRQILSFSRQNKPKPTPVKLHLLVKESLKLLRSTTPTTISFVDVIDEDCGVIMADATQIHQLIMNLFTNAVHAMDEKGTIEVSLQGVEVHNEDFHYDKKVNPGSYVKLSVSDTGAGMDKETIERIFDPFYTTKKIGEGTGMGLSVVHGVVENSGGFIQVDSEPGKGSIFNIYFPLQEYEEISETIDSDELIPTGTEKVLFVDDEEDLAVMGKRILERLGYKVISETSSTAALETFKSDPNNFDVLITDQSMPDVSGLELIAKILNIRNDMPIILCTGYSTKVSENNAEEMGVRKLLRKPYQKRELAEAIKEVLA